MAYPKGYFKQNDDRCNNCGAYLEAGQKYCTECGTKRGEGVFDPENNVLAVLYGPPYSAVYECAECGYIFVKRGLGSAECRRYCPVCGGKCRLKSEE